MPKKYRIETDKGNFIVETDEPDELDQIRQQQAAKYPTSAELGGFPGMVAPTPNSMGHQFMQGLGQSVKDTLAGGNTPPGLITGMEDPSWHAMSLAFPVPLAKTAIAGVAAGKEAIAKALGASKVRAGENFDFVKQMIGNQAGDYSAALPSVQGARDINAVTKATIPGPLRGSAATDILAGNPLTYDEGRLAASGAGQLSQFETARTNRPMLTQLKEFAHIMDEGNREMAAKNGLAPIYDAAMKEWSRGANLEAKMATAKKWLTRAAITAALGGAGTIGGKMAYDSYMAK